MKRIYIASPYTNGDVAVNVSDSMHAANAILDYGYSPYCPLLSHFLHMQQSRSWGEWIEHDLIWLNVCDALVRLPGESKGADLEVAEARRIGIPVYFGLDAFYAQEQP